MFAETFDHAFTMFFQNFAIGFFFIALYLVAWPNSLYRVIIDNNLFH